MLRLGCHSKEAGDDGNLPGNVSFPHPSHLSLPNHVHHLVSLQRSPCRFKGKEAHPRLDQAFDKTMVLFHQVIEVFDLPQFDTLGKYSPRGADGMVLIRINLREASEQKASWK